MIVNNNLKLIIILNIADIIKKNVKDLNFPRR